MNKNTAHIEGRIGKVRITSVKDGVVTANATINTYVSLPFGDGSKPIPVLAKIQAKGDLAKQLLEFDKMTNGQKIGPGQEGYVPFNVVIDGAVTGVNDQIVIDSPEGKTKKVAKIHKDSNTASVKGTVKDIIDNGKTITALMESEGGIVPIHMRYEKLPSGLDKLPSGKLQKGDRIEINGPILGAYYTDGTKRILVSNIVPRKIAPLQKKIKKTSSQSL